MVCLQLLFEMQPGLLLVNGPGTCIPPVLAAFILRACRLADCKIVFIESVCRVHSVSLSGRVAMLLVDSFLLQWPQPAVAYVPNQRLVFACSE